MVCSPLFPLSRRLWCVLWPGYIHCGYNRDGFNHIITVCGICHYIFPMMYSIFGGHDTGEGTHRRLWWNPAPAWGCVKIAYLVRIFRRRHCADCMVPPLCIDTRGGVVVQNSCCKAIYMY